MLIKNLSDKSRNKAIQIVNAIVRIGKLKVSTTIATVTRKVKEAIAAYNEKRVNNVKIYYADI